MLARTLKYFRSIVLITCTLLANTLQAENVIRTDGVALITSTLDKDIYRTRAIENAFQNLASKGVQTLDSFSIIENGQVLIDQVHLASKLGIQEYRVVKEEIKGKTYHVTLDVVLNEQQNKKKNNLCLRASPPSIDFSIVLEKKFNKMPSWVEFSDNFITQAIAARKFEPKLQRANIHFDDKAQSSSMYSLYKKDNTKKSPDNFYRLHSKVVLEPSRSVNLIEKTHKLKIKIFSYVTRKDKKILEQTVEDQFIIQQRSLNGLISPVTRRDWPSTKDKIANFILETLDQQLTQLNCLKFFPKIHAKSGNIYLDYGSLDGITPSDMFLLKNSDAKKIYFKLENLEDHQAKIKIVSKVESLEGLVGSEVEVVSGS